MRKFSRKFILRDVNVIDIENGSFSKKNVYINNGFIEQVTTSLDLSSGFQEMNCKNKFLMPGLIDAHVHITSTFIQGRPKTRDLTWLQSQVKKNFYHTLYSGVTTVRDMASPVKSILGWKTQIEQGRIPGPRLVTCGPVLTCENGFPTFASPKKFPFLNLLGQLKVEFGETCTPADLDSFIWNLVESGVDFIKIGYSRKNFDEFLTPLPVLSDKNLKVIVETARKYNKETAVNIAWNEDLNHIINFPVTSIEHLVRDGIIDNETIFKIKERGFYIVPTLGHLKNQANFSGFYDYLKSPASLEKFEEEPRDALLQTAGEILNGKQWQRGAESIEKMYENASENLRKMIDADILLVMGSDAGTDYSFFGDITKELHLMEEHGLSRLKILQGATILAARLLGMETDIGTVTAGKFADLLLLDNNPLENLGALNNIEIIFKEGKAYEPSPQKNH